MKPLTPATPHLIIMVGIPGAGKTTFAEHFAKTFHAPFVSVAAITKTADLSEAASQKLAIHFLNELLKTNRTLIFEGIGNTKTARQALVKRAEAAGYQPMIVWVQTETNEALRRATKRTHSERLDETSFAQAVKHFSAPLAQEKPVVISGKHTYTTQLKIVLKQLAGHTRSSSEDASIPAERPRTGRSIIIR